uniref:Uncharacterized protein n=1 Tax=viral metagenome TaxID=1070528 RepID=A0A6C0BK17_9ZZZZ
MSLLEKARESAARARARAHRRLQAAGGQEQEFEQEGGRKRFEILTKHADAEARKRASEGKKVPTAKAVRDSIRSFTAEVNGVPLGEKRYFHGHPMAAARKVVSMVNREIKPHKISGYEKKTKEGKKVIAERTADGKGVEFSSIGEGNAIRIKLTEVSKGVLKATTFVADDGKRHHDKYVFEYFGWRVPVDSSFARGNRTIQAKYRNKVIPARGAASLAEAKAKQEALASKPKVAAARAALKARNAAKKK